MDYARLDGSVLNLYLRSRRTDAQEYHVCRGQKWELKVTNNEAHREADERGMRSAEAEERTRR
jgi:hypothetical protein